MYEVRRMDSHRRISYLFFEWPRDLTPFKKMVFAFGFACVTGLSAQVKISLPGTPVPITMQTFFVLLAGVLLGRRWGGVSQLIYVSAGALGVQWFAGSSIFGPTGGYLIGFVLAPFFLGYVIDRYVKYRNFTTVLFLMFFANFFLIYIPGLIQLGFYLYLIKGSFPGFSTLLSMGFFPFLPGALVKVTLAAAIAVSIMPKDVDSSNQEIVNQSISESVN